MAKRVSVPMRDVLERIAAHERAGRLGADVSLYPVQTVLALARRDLIQPNVDGSRRLTAAGWDELKGRVQS